MCKYHGGSYEGTLRVDLAHPRSDGVSFCHVDPCIQPLVQGINDAGIQTINSCCGHGQRPGWIAFEDGRHLIIARNHAEMRQISDQFPPLSDPQKRVTRTGGFSLETALNRHSQRSAQLTGKT